MNRDNSLIDMMSLTFLQISQHAISLGASDIHISPNMPPMVRIDGVLKEVRVATQSSVDVMNVLSSIMTLEQVDKFNSELELNFIYEAPDHVRYRVNAFTAAGEPSATLRIIPSKIPSLNALDAPHTIKSIASYQSGLVVVTGTLGSGKSTTLAAMVDYINNNSSKKIITIEDPVEFLHKSARSLISQRSVNSDTKSYATALENALHEDPDIIVIDELKTAASTRRALMMANSGCLVLTTLNATSTSHAIQTILDAFQTDINNLLANALSAIVTQRLIPKATGVGRVAAYEIMPSTQTIATLIRENKIVEIQAVIQTMSLEGAISMDDYIQKLILCGSIREDHRSSRTGIMSNSIDSDDGEF